MDAFVKLSNFEKIVPYMDLFKQGLQVTILLSACTVAIGFVLALILAVMRLSNFTPFLWLARTFPGAFGFFEYEKDGSKRDSGA